MRTIRRGNRRRRRLGLVISIRGGGLRRWTERCAFSTIVVKRWVVSVCEQLFAGGNFSSHSVRCRRRSVAIWKESERISTYSSSILLLCIERKEEHHLTQHPETRTKPHSSAWKESLHFFAAPWHYQGVIIRCSCNRDSQSAARKAPKTNKTLINNFILIQPRNDNCNCVRWSDPTIPRTEQRSGCDWIRQE